jgi:uncharacterized protein (DUF1778 family)
VNFMANLEQTVSRLNFRLPFELKEKIERAAIVSGVTVTDFAISALVSSANDVLDKHQNRILSNRDRDIFWRCLKIRQNRMKH